MSYSAVQQLLFSQNRCYLVFLLEKGYDCLFFGRRGEIEIRNMQFKSSIETAREKKILAKDALKDIYDLESQIKSIK